MGEGNTGSIISYSRKYIFLLLKYFSINFPNILLHCNVSSYLYQQITAVSMRKILKYICKFCYEFLHKGKLFCYMSFTYKWALMYQIELTSADSPRLKNGYHLSLFCSKHFLENNVWVQEARHKLKDVFFANLLYSEARWQYC